jgi:hypothetical protein
VGTSDHVVVEEAILTGMARTSSGAFSVGVPEPSPCFATKMILTWTGIGVDLAAIHAGPQLTV